MIWDVITFLWPYLISQINGNCGRGPMSVDLQYLCVQIKKDKYLASMNMILVDFNHSNVEFISRNIKSMFAFYKIS